MVVMGATEGAEGDTEIAAPVPFSATELKRGESMPKQHRRNLRPPRRERPAAPSALSRQGGTCASTRWTVVHAQWGVAL
jgi:hypothetical protein